jgi:hypothetical protein
MHGEFSPVRTWPSGLSHSSTTTAAGSAVPLDVPQTWPLIAAQVTMTSRGSTSPSQRASLLSSAAPSHPWNSG